MIYFTQMYVIINWINLWRIGVGVFNFQFNIFFYSKTVKFFNFKNLIHFAMLERLSNS